MRLVSQIEVGIDPGAADPERGESALRMSGHADPVRIDMQTPHLVLQKVRDVERDVTRPLPELAARVHHGRVVGVGPIVIEHGNKIAARWVNPRRSISIVRMFGCLIRLPWFPADYISLRVACAPRTAPSEKRQPAGQCAPFWQSRPSTG